MTLITGFDLCRAAMSAPGVTAPERSVLMVLAIMANGEAKCWPPINDSEDGSGLTTRCVLSERAVQRAIQQLVRLGHITRRQLRHGVIYTVHPVSELTPATETGVGETGDTMAGVSEAARPATQAPKLPKTTIPPKVAGKPDAAGTLVPVDFVPIVKPDSITGKAMAAWPPGVEAEQVEHFIDRHTTQGTKSLDWQASWRTWVKNWKSFNGKRTYDRRPAQRGNDLTPMARALVERELADLVLRSEPLPAELPVLVGEELADAKRALDVYRAAPKTSSPRAVDRVMAKLVVAYPAARVSEAEALARLDVYAEQLSDIPADVLMAGAMAAARTIKFFPSISEIRAAAMSQPAPPRILRQWRLSQMVEASARRSAVPSEVERCRPEEAAEIVAGLGSRFSVAADPTRPKPQGRDPDRGARMPSREDYVRMFGVDPGDKPIGEDDQPDEQIAA